MLAPGPLHSKKKRTTLNCLLSMGGSRIACNELSENTKKKRRQAYDGARDSLENWRFAAAPQVSSTSSAARRGRVAGRWGAMELWSITEPN
jgi:hypothetical protein